WVEIIREKACGRSRRDWLASLPVRTHRPTTLVLMPPPRLLYLVTEDWYFMSHRLPMARAARAAGFEVHVATRVDRHGPQIEAEGFRLHPLTWRRGSINPLGFALALWRIRRFYKELGPDIVHHVAMQPSIMGSLAALGLPPARINAIAGFGFAFTSQTA